MSAPAGKYFSLSYYLAYPSARGFTHVTDGDATVPPHFETGFLRQ